MGFCVKTKIEEKEERRKDGLVGVWLKTKDHYSVLPSEKESVIHQLLY